MIDWSEAIRPPRDAAEFAAAAIYVICNSGMKVTVAAPIAVRCLAALAIGKSATTVFGHPGKGPAIDVIWQQREQLFSGFTAENAKLEYLETLPWIGPVTKHHLAKNLGMDTAKPDVHMERLARRDGTTTATLCRRLALLTGYRVATIDSVLWRACADGLLNSRAYEAQGWKAAYRPGVYDLEFEQLLDSVDQQASDHVPAA
ncbi:MAG: hypothetical protein ABR588_02680 [Sphingomicrobium sp.]|nr:hypothetical protein [Sphingomonadales bacterium]